MRSYNEILQEHAQYLKEIKIGDHIFELPKSKLPASASVDNGKYPFICSSADVKRTDVYLQDMPAVVMGTGGIASVNLGKGKFAYSTDTWAFRADGQTITTEFLFRKIQQQLHKIDYAAFEGSGLKHLRKDYVKNLMIEVPQNLLISAKMEKILQTIDQAIEQTEVLIQKQQKMKAGLIHDLFTRGMTVDGRLRPTRAQAPELYKETPIGWIPKEWKINSILDLAHESRGSTVIGPFGSDLVMTDYRTEGVPIIFVRDVKEDRFNWISNVFITTNKAQSLYAHRVNAGDILVTKMGLPPCISSVYPDSMPMGVITADIIRMTPNTSKVRADWLSSTLNFDRTKRQVAAITAGVTRPKVTLKDFRSLKIAVPSPSEQEMMMRSINKQKRLIEIEESRLVKFKQQKTGLMKDLLTGEVPVKIDEAEVANV